MIDLEDATTMGWAQYHKAVVDADNLRRCQAYYIAYCELGPEPKVSDYHRYRDYVAKLNRLAEDKFRQLI